MNFIPCGHRLLVKPFKAAEVDEQLKRAKALGIQLVQENERREDAGITKGVVMSIGPTAWKDFQSEPWCKVGDTIIYAKHAPFFVEDCDNVVYGLLNDADVIAVIKE